MSLKLSEGWLTFVLLVLTQLAMTGAMVSAGWVEGLEILPWISVLAVVWGFTFAKLGIHGAILHPLSLPVGGAQIVYLISTLLPDGDLDYRLLALWDRLVDWIEVTASGGIATDNLLFLLFVASLAWIIGYFGAWTVFREHNGWWTATTTGTALVINLSYAPYLELFFLVFLLCAALLIVRLDGIKRERKWQRTGVTYERGLKSATLRSSFLMAALALGVAWSAPKDLLLSHQASEAFAAIARPWDNVQAEFGRLFGGVGAGNQPSFSAFGRTLPLKSLVALGDEAVLSVAGTEPRRLRGVVYDRYTGKGWLSPDRPEYHIPSWAPQSDIAADYDLRKVISQTITVVQPRGTIVFAPSHIQKLSIPVAAQIEVKPPVRIDVGAGTDSLTSAEVKEIARVVQEKASEMNLSLGDTDVELPVTQSVVARWIPNPFGRFEIAGVWMRGKEVSSLALREIDADYADVTAMRNPGMLRRGFQYTVEFSASVADEQSLRKEDADYPEWVKQRYLPLPRTVTARTVRLARQLTSRHDNTYDKAIALEQYLRTLSYSENVNVPPSVNDFVDHFLFVGRQGYCDYFASAFVVMIRALGIPARVVSGYAPGEVDVGKGITVVRDWQAHSWPEVYFPKYGWIEYEPTPSQPGIERPRTPVELPEELVILPPTTDLEDLLSDESDLPDDDLAITQTPGGAISGNDGGAAATVFQGLVGLLAVFVVGYVSILFLWHRGMGGLSPAKVAYAKMYRLASWLGIRPLPHQTPNEFANVLLTQMPEERDGIEQITRSYVRQQFGHKATTPEEENQLANAWRRLRRTLIKRRFGLR